MYKRLTLTFIGKTLYGEITVPYLGVALWFGTIPGGYALRPMVTDRILAVTHLSERKAEKNVTDFNLFFSAQNWNSCNSIE